MHIQLEAPTVQGVPPKIFLKFFKNYEDMFLMPRCMVLAKNCGKEGGGD